MVVGSMFLSWRNGGITGLSVGRDEEVCIFGNECKFDLNV